MSEPTKSRRAAREAAFQAAYQCTVGHVAINRACDDVLGRKNYADEIVEFITDLADGMVTETRVLDDTFGPFLKSGWTPDRLAISDLLALRMAVVELYDFPEIPPKVTITEAINIAKKFGTEESGRFVNGVLAKVLAESPKKDWPIIDAITIEGVSEDLEIPITSDDEPASGESDTQQTKPPDRQTSELNGSEQESLEPPNAQTSEPLTWSIKSDD